MTDPADPDAVEAFWRRARAACGLATTSAPEAWAFGSGAAQADALLALVLNGTKTATAGALWDYEAEGEAVPRPGDLSIALDGAGRPRALLRVTAVEVLPFDEVDEEHARLEGEGDRSLAYWREVHQRFFTDVACHDRGFSRQMPVVVERFEVLHTEP
ncbi:ASCH domain-containing protein [Marmoricola endophyticus]|uniref:ASCH domain-containing protein n=1 Tax=Marmoricola endophyticus TaxID=2040280 RepID=UPI00166D2E30|nr:ASCH domain-containing protein [Marmoricola endophyticus]